MYRRSASKKARSTASCLHYRKYLRFLINECHMESQIGLPVLVALMVCLAGCSGVPGRTSPEESSPTESPSPSATQAPSLTASDAQQRVLAAETNRVTNVLEHMNNISGSSVGIYGKSTAETLNRSSTDITVKVRMSYSYEYHCGDQSGAVDGLSTIAIYRVTSLNTSVVEIIETVDNFCA